MRSNRTIFLLLMLIAISASGIFAQKGKIAGTVVDKTTGEPLPFANVFVEGTSLGAATDLEGNFAILNLQPGVYDVTASIVGYQKQTVTEVRVNADFTTRLNFELSEGSIEMDAVVVQGERNPLIRQDLTNPTVAITGETIDELPVDQISDVIKLQAGVVVGNDGQLHFRGGYGNEVAFTLNGVSLNDPYGNQSSIGLATNAVQEVSVSTGTFSAEYGNALSGVVNYITREGDDKYTFSVRSYVGDYLSGHDDIYYNIDDIDPLNRFRGEFTLGGPLPFLKKGNFFFSGVYEDFGGSTYGVRKYNTTDSYLYANEFPAEDPRNGKSGAPLYFNPFGSDSTGLPTGDGEILPLNDSESLNLQGNISYRFSPTFKLKFESVYDKSNFQGGGTIGTFAARYAPDVRGYTYNEALHNAVELTHTVNSSLFYTLKGSYTVNTGEFYKYKEYDDPRYLPTVYQETLGNTAFLTGGTDNLRFNRETRSVGIKGDMVAQVDKHEVKAGFETRFFELDVESYNVEIGKVDNTAEDGFGTLTPADLLDPTTVLIRRKPTSPNQYTQYNREPKSLAGYVRDKIELASSMILNVGLRYEYFDPNAKYNPNISEELQREKQGEIDSTLFDVDPKHMISPRFSVSYPITDRGSIRFSYGHFYQTGSLSSLYRNPYYYASLGGTPTFGNPNVEPQKSVQYEMGLTQGLTDNLRLEVTAYYKDVTDYIFTQTVFTPLGKEYNVLTNLSYSNVRGVTISLFRRRAPKSLFQASLDYTFQIAEGNRTEPDEDLFFSEASGKQTETYLVPLAFDRAHVLNATLNLVKANNWTLGLVAFLQTGTPYTPSLPSQIDPKTYEQNSASRPIQWNVDLKFEKYFQFGDFKYSLFLQVDNLFDIMREVYVYSSSGRALQSVEETINSYQFDDLRDRIDAGEPGLISLDALHNYYYERPANVSSPREIKLGFSVIFN